MKTIIKERVEKTTYYICDICGKEHRFKSDANLCMKIHACQHEFKYKLVSNSGDSICDLYIRSECEKCGIRNTEIDQYLEIDPDELPQELIKAIYDHFHNLKRVANEDNL